MNSSVGKPLLSLVTAACIAVPAGMPAATAAVPECAVRAEADAGDRVDPAPRSLRWTPDTSASVFGGHAAMGLAPSVDVAANRDVHGTDAFRRDNVAAVRTDFAHTRLFQRFAPLDDRPEAVVAPDLATAAARHVDPILLVELLTFPYHNAYSIITAVGAALNSVVLTALLPVTAGYYLLDNQIDKIEPYIQTTLTDLRNALPNIVTTIKNEIAYDIDLFNQVFNPVPDAERTDVPDSARSATETAVSQTDLDDADTAQALAPSAGVPAEDDPGSPTNITATQQVHDGDDPEVSVDTTARTTGPDDDQRTGHRRHAAPDSTTPAARPGGRHRLSDSSPADTDASTASTAGATDSADRGDGPRHAA